MGDGYRTVKVIRDRLLQSGRFRCRGGTRSKRPCGLLVIIAISVTRSFIGGEGVAIVEVVLRLIRRKWFAVRRVKCSFCGTGGGSLRSASLLWILG